MKPENAVPMKTPHDLSSWAIIQAVTEISNYFMAVYGRLNDLNLNLKVPSQLYSIALSKAHAFDYNVEIDFTYGADEWSLCGTRFIAYYPQTGTIDFDTYEIWSPGA